MDIQLIHDDKKRYLDLLLLADEQEDMIDRYLARGDLFVMLDGDAAVAVAVVTDEGGGICELKNLAVAPSHQRQGLGGQIVRHLLRRFGATFHTMLVGTGNSCITIPFYQSCGFVEHHRVKDYMLAHYDQPIMECGVQLTDMVVLRQPLWVMQTKRLGFRRICHDDHAALRPILGDVETMYAWEYGFSDAQITRWIETCLERYERDGYAYFAAIDKDSGELIGMMGPLDEDIDGAVMLGVGYIVAKRHWGKGYAVEGAQGWIAYAFEALAADRIIADIRPENTASLRVAEKLGMHPVGRHVKHHNGKEMPHLIYELRRSN